MVFIKKWDVANALLLIHGGKTETGGFMITPLPGAMDLKPGSATRPFFGVQPAIVDNMGKYKTVFVKVIW